MTERDVTPGQAQLVGSWLVPTMLKLHALRDRMTARAFAPDDPLMAKVIAADEAVRLLRLALHEIEGRARPYPPR